jgi:hypothetical protein
MEETPENGKESSHPSHANGIIIIIIIIMFRYELITFHWTAGRLPIAIVTVYTESEGGRFLPLHCSLC